MMPFAVESITHDALSQRDLAGLSELFDAEYLADFGAWDPHQPYGYAPHDLHVIARVGDQIVGHVGWQRRAIAVGSADVVIAGVGGVLISPRVRGQRAGARLLSEATVSMIDAGGLEFGYLGCREEVVAFYEACGWRRITAIERSLDRMGRPVEQPAGPPILTFALGQDAREWPRGSIDLRGRPW